MVKKNYDAVIIGAGIIGNCIAYELCKKGWKTLSVDKLDGSGAGSTAASCAIVRASYSTYEGVAIAYEGFDIWAQWSDYLKIRDPQGMAILKDTGQVFFKTHGHDWQKILGLFDTIGVAYEEWDLDRCKKKMPFLDFHQYWPVTRPEKDDRFFDPNPEYIEGAIFNPGGGYMSDPKLSTHNVQAAAEAVGADFLFNQEVIDIHKTGGRVSGITLGDQSRIDAPVVINAAGPHSFIINRLTGVEEGMKIKTRPLRHEVAVVPAPPGMDYQKEGYYVSDGDSGVYFRPEVGNTILIGSEDPDCDSKDWITDPDNYNNQITDEQWTAQVYRCARRLRDLPVPGQKKGIADLYDVTDDWYPIYDKSDLDGFYMAIGTSGNQYKNGPIAGMMMTHLIEQCENGRDHDADPVPYTLPILGLTINLGFFSRRREINEDSSFSVNG